MQSGEKPGLSSDEKDSRHHIEVKKKYYHDAWLQKFLQALYLKDEIEWISNPNLKEIETYVLFHVCTYGEEDTLSLKEGIKRACLLLENQLSFQAHVLIILYRDLKVSFPERKLRREKFMSELISDEMLSRECLSYQNRIRIIHEFGTNNLQDSLQQLTGNHVYFEILS